MHHARNPETDLVPLSQAAFSSRFQRLEPIPCSAKEGTRKATQLDKKATNGRALSFTLLEQLLRAGAPVCQCAQAGAALGRHGTGLAQGGARSHKRHAYVMLVDV